MVGGNEGTSYLLVLVFENSNWHARPRRLYMYSFILVLLLVSSAQTEAAAAQA